MKKTLQLPCGLIFFVFVACSVRIIAPYDEVTDSKVSDLQETIASKFAKWQRDVPPIENEYDFYDQTEGVLEVLISRSESIEKSEIIVSMLKKVQENLQTIKQLHKNSQLTVEVLDQVKPDIMAQFNSIQKFQMALKRAEESR